jgi:hypothetical protein
MNGLDSSPARLKEVAKGERKRHRNTNVHVTRTRSLTCICGKKKVAVKTDLREFSFYLTENQNGIVYHAATQRETWRISIYICSSLYRRRIE